MSTEVNGNSNIVPFNPGSGKRRRAIGVAIVLVLASVVAVSSMRQEQAGSQPVEKPKPYSSAEFVYFPSQFANQWTSGEDAGQRKAAEEHIQGF